MHPALTADLSAIINGPPDDPEMRNRLSIAKSLAQVAELVDALVSGTSAFTGVEVRVLSWAPPQNLSVENQTLDAK